MPLVKLKHQLAVLGGWDSGSTLFGDVVTTSGLESTRPPPCQQEQNVGKLHGPIAIGVGVGVCRAKSAQHRQQVCEVHRVVAIQISSATFVVLIPKIKQQLGGGV